MSPKRLKALQWLFEVKHLGIYPGDLDYTGPSNQMLSLMVQDLQVYFSRHGYRLTEKGLCDLHEATR